jgi:hypothetical protein
MGLSFHYSGRIADPEELPDMIEEVEDIAKAYNWKYAVFDRQFPDGSVGKPEYNQRVYGISFTPPECETIDICFLSNGRMSNAFNLEFWGKNERQEERKYLYMLSVKTQFAGFETHKFIIQLFRYLNEKYFADFNLTDEGGYWETKDENVLRYNFQKYNDLLDSFVSALENHPIRTNEGIEEYFLRMMKNIQENKKKNED